MKPVATAAQSRALDAAFVGRFGLPSIVLMETASRALAAHVVGRHPEAARRGVVVVCGGGNNGGDGYGCARWLAGWGVPVRTWSLAERSSGDAAMQRAACEALGVPDGPGLADAAVVVDAIFGTGLSRPVTGAAAAVISAIARAFDEGRPVVAADVPSGICADTGAVLGVAARATSTLAFGALKPGLLAGEGASRSGDVEVADIGLGAAMGLGLDGAVGEPAPGAPVGGDVATPASPSGSPPTPRSRAPGPWIAELIEASDLAPLLPTRAPADHKGRSGHLFVVAGSARMAGAAVLACRGALSAGAGLVTLVAARGALPRLGALPPEVMVLVVGEGDRLDALPTAAVDAATAILAGPGLGGGLGGPAPAVDAALRALWDAAPIPVLLDADALGCAVLPGRGARVLTPHPGEAARLLGTSTAAVEADRFTAARALSRSGVAVLKGRFTLIAAADLPIAVNPTGGPALASGGTGDVLAGVIGGLLARGVGAFDAARVGAWVHGRAADRLASLREDGWSATDVAAELPAAMADLRAAVVGRPA